MNCNTAHIKINQMSIVVAELTNGRESSVMNEVTSPAPPPAPVRNPKSEGMMGSLRIAILIFVATANTIARVPNSAVPIQNRFTNVIQTA